MTIRACLRAGRERLAKNEAGGLEAEVLLAHVLGVNRAWLYANPDHVLADETQENYTDLVGRRARGEPIAYLTAVREFWSLPLMVTSDVLIPRPETELLVETVLEFLPVDLPCRFADLGTGSGAVALAVASERPLCEVHATEISAAALDVARANGDELLPGRVQYHAGSWCEPLTGRFLVLASNPPYVAEHDRHLSEGDCYYEPRTALTPGGDGLAAIRQISDQARDYLEPGGWLAFEHGIDQGSAARAALDSRGYREIQTRQDLENRDRVTLGRWPR
jgi:release factor glutamine methyltransferase